MSSYGSRDELETSMIKSHGFLGHLAFCFPRSAFWSEYYAKCGLVECEIGLTHDGQYVALTPASMAKHLGSPTKNAIPTENWAGSRFLISIVGLISPGTCFLCSGPIILAAFHFSLKFIVSPTSRVQRFTITCQVEKSRSLPFCEMADMTDIVLKILIFFQISGHGKLNSTSISCMYCSVWPIFSICKYKLDFPTKVHMLRIKLQIKYDESKWPLLRKLHARKTSMLFVSRVRG